ncbi:MAG TPA: hypothetical protein VIY49_36680 [Bryobacteraceae bacterium]
MRALVLLRGALLLIAGGNMPAQDVAVVRVGPNSWSRTVAGSVSVEPQGRLEVEARGHIVVRGGDAVDRISYKLVQRVHARSESEARDLFGSGVLTPAVLGPVTRIDVHQNSSPNVSNQLQLTVPRNLTVVSVESQFGAGVEAYDLDGRVNALARSGDIRVDHIGGAVLAKARSGNLFFGRVGAIEECFTGAGSIFVENVLGGVKSCHTGGGDLVVKQAGAPVVLENEGGNITVERAAASVEAHAISGMIQIGQAGGPVTADTQGGSIQVGAAPGVRAESAQGTVRVRGSSGPMDVSTAFGNILAVLVAGARLRDSTLAAASGDITVFIPFNFPVSVVVLNDRGGYQQFMSEFNEVRAMALPFAPRSPVVAQGRINGGGPVLRINAGTGVVYLRKSR